MHLRVLAVAAAIILGLLAWPTGVQAESEKVKTNQSTSLYRRAGEQSPVILTLKAGQTVTLLAKDGRWLRVRVSGRTGWIPRSKVDLPEEDDDVVRNTRRQPFVGGRGTKRGFGGEAGPNDRVGADAVGEGDEPKANEPKVSATKPGDKPDVKADEKADVKPGKGDEITPPDDEGEGEGEGEGEKPAVRPTARVESSTVVYDKPDASGGKAFTADPKAVLYVSRSQGNWTRVTNDEGDAGWVLTTRLRMEEGEPAAAGPRTRAIHGRGRVGVTIVSQSLAISGGQATPPDNYTATSSAVTAALGGGVLYPVKKQWWLGADLAYDFAYAFPGISYLGKTTSFQFHNINATATAGYSLADSRRGTTVFGRLGFHYDSFQVANVEDFTQNTAKLPNQIIMGPTVGAAIAMPTLGRKWGLMVTIDTMLFGASLEQTKNLEDGTSPSATAAYMGTSLVYRWKPKVDLQFTLDVDYTSISFGGPPPATSLRAHQGMGNASGSDLSASLAAGVAYAF